MAFERSAVMVAWEAFSRAYQRTTPMSLQHIHGRKGSERERDQYLPQERKVEAVVYRDEEYEDADSEDCLHQACSAEDG